MDTQIVITPNTGKEILKNLAWIFFVIILAFALLAYVQSQTDMIGILLEAFEIRVSDAGIIAYTGFFLAAFALLTLMLNYLNIKNVKYSFYDDRIEYSQVQLLLFMQKESIPMQDIARLTYSKQGIMNKALGCGEITIDLTGMQIPSIKLLSIDDPEGTTAILAQKVNEYRMRQQMQYQEEKNVEGILK